MSQAVRFGVLGCGRIVQRGFLPAIAATPAASLQAIASRRPGVARQWADEHNVPRACDSYEELIADPDVDAIYVPATGDEHARWTIAAAKAGKHVLCEKPLARTVAEAEQMIAACHDAGVILQEAFMWRQHPRAKKTRELLQEGAIGSLRLIVASFSFDLPGTDWRLQPEKGGGAMWDLGCYGIDASRFFAEDEPTEVHARARWWKTGVDMTMQIALAFPGDILANIDCSFEAPFRCHAELVGDAGRIVLPDAFQPGDESVILLQRSTQRGAPLEEVPVPPANQYACQVAAFCDSIAAGRRLEPAEDGLANMRVLERVLADAHRNRDR
ncbi:MAG: Gfo/Idh/MocA family protein [Maioricimonas sp. JB049]